MAAAGAMISLTFAVSPPLTLLPPRLEPVDVNGNVISQQHRTIETVGAAGTDTFERRSEATEDIPPTPLQPREGLEGVSGGLRMLPMPQDAPPVTQVHPQDFRRRDQAGDQVLADYPGCPRDEDSHDSFPFLCPVRLRPLRRSHPRGRDTSVLFFLLAPALVPGA